MRPVSTAAFSKRSSGGPTSARALLEQVNPSRPALHRIEAYTVLARQPPTEARRGAARQTSTGCASVLAAGIPADKHYSHSELAAR